jgi:hypothetical protein
MTFIDFIGFVIAMLAFFILIGKQVREERKRRQNPEAYEEESEQHQQEVVRELLRSLNIEVPAVQQEAKPPPPPAKPSYDRDLNTQKEVEISSTPAPRKTVHSSQRSVFKDPYLIRKKADHQEAYLIKKQKASSAKRILGKDLPLKQAILLREILGPPKGLE